MKSSRVADCLDHMLEAARQASAYIEGMNKADFEDDKRTQQAVILNLIILGEEVTKLLKVDEAFAELHPGVPWRSMKGMRNRIAHGYFEINLDTVWETVQRALPELISQLQTIRLSLK
ncbi:DUF86 domain-containing protein [Rhodoferax sp.]|uniref:HepT-like ribonuclease domain-containing protein n=1 Tax=Rhodoferax sp. TaxID=50421 RepID=UPI002614F75F|nr:DUF86 domain-containing protein [Rhodoferax sp.]MDD2810940.1 DUF86 domain-containing protein [Rhodoferax sp.]MDD4942967.1 DUF86 domain-containing protein [Rhodoferax sp.]